MVTTQKKKLGYHEITNVRLENLTIPVNYCSGGTPCESENFELKSIKFIQC